MFLLVSTDNYKVSRCCGITVTSISTAQSRYFQMGDDANQLEDELEACLRAYEQGSKFTYEQLVDYILDPYFEGV